MLKWKVSVWLTLIAIALASSQMHPGFSTLLAVLLLTILLLSQRLVAHYEGILIVQSAKDKGHSVRFVMLREIVIDGLIIGGMVALLAVAIRHIPMVWFPVSS